MRAEESTEWKWQKLCRYVVDLEVMLVFILHLNAESIYLISALWALFCAIP